MAMLMGITPDLIVLDMRMPQMDGAMFLDVVRSYLRLQHVPVILWTAYPDGQETARARKSCVAAVFRKGEDYTTLLDAIDQIAAPRLPAGDRDEGASAAPQLPPN
jgi:CheY-like chemotaxis protein